MAVIRNKIKKEVENVRGEVKKRTLGYIITALGLVAGLSWNDAVRSTIDHFLPAGGGGLVAKFVYAVTLTMVVVAVSVYLTRIFEGKDKEEAEDKEKSSDKKP